VSTLLIAYSAGSRISGGRSNDTVGVLQDDDTSRNKIESVLASLEM